MPRQVTSPTGRKAKPITFTIAPEAEDALPGLQTSLGHVNRSHAINHAILAAAGEAQPGIAEAQQELVESQQRVQELEHRIKMLDAESDALSKELNAYRANPLFHEIPEVQDILITCARSQASTTRLYAECQKGAEYEAQNKRHVGDIQALAKARRSLSQAGDEKPWHTLGLLIAEVHKATNRTLV